VVLHFNVGHITYPAQKFSSFMLGEPA